MNNRKVIFLVEYDKAGDFFFRLAAASDAECVFVTSLPSIFLRARGKGYKALLTGFRKGQCSALLESNLRETKAVALKALSIQKAKTRVKEVFDILESLVGDNNYRMDVSVLVWNGASISGVAAKEIKRINPKVKLLFLEIANLPGKIFADPEGANAQSSLYRDPSILDSYALPSEESFNDWVDDYVAEKSQANYTTPQAKKKTVTFLAVLDFIYLFLLGNNYFGSPAAKLKNYIGMSGNRKEVFVRPSSGFGDGYAFLPLQVSNDSQLLINSKIGNEEAIKLVSEKEKTLVVKPHPAERNISYLSDVVSGISNVYISNENTFDLIRSSSKVYTINSTVGLEALILGKEVEFLGRSYFSFFDKNRLKRYLFSYLLDVDFFSGNAISLTMVEKVLQRAR